jgi:hypothetical protein
LNQSDLSIRERIGGVSLADAGLALTALASTSSLRRAWAAEGGAVRTTTAAAVTADVLPASIPGQCHEFLIETGTITLGVTSAQGDRAASQFSAEIS